MFNIKKCKGDRAAMLSYITTATEIKEAEFCGIMQWATELKANCLKIQLPVALDVLDFLSRLPAE